MPADSTHPLATKRLVIGHLTVCQGCCWGNTENGRPPVPVDWLKKEWRARGLLKRVQLTISGCLFRHTYAITHTVLLSQNTEVSICS